jgi:uncharacterized membrane protein SpoIIM required for sporulation
VLFAAAVITVASVVSAAFVDSAADHARIPIRTVEDLCDPSGRASSWSDFSEILLTNSGVMLNLVLGGFTLGLRSTTQLAWLGIQVGTLAVVAALSTKSWPFVVAILGTHGLLELPAFAAGGGTGFGIASLIVAKLTKRRAVDWKPVSVALIRELAPAVVLLVSAAVVEEFLTLRVVSWSLGCRS